MKAIQLELFDSSEEYFLAADIALNNPTHYHRKYDKPEASGLDEPASGSKDSPESYIESWCPRVIDGTHYETDPCKVCPLREVCADDDCGIKLYEIDQEHPPYGRFEDWLDGVFE